MSYTNLIGQAPPLAPPGLTVAWRVTVGPGSKEGVVRPFIGGVEGPEVVLPAEPGTYTYPVTPHVVSGRGVAIVQDSGGHAILDRAGPSLGARRMGPAFLCNKRPLISINP